MRVGGGLDEWEGRRELCSGTSFPSRGYLHFECSERVPEYLYPCLYLPEPFDAVGSLLDLIPS